MTDILQAFDATRNLQSKPVKALCYAPFVHLTLSPNGDASACDLSRSHVLGNLQQQRLDEIWQGARIQQFRALLQDGVFPQGCETCKWSLNAGNFVSHPIRDFDDAPVRLDTLWPPTLTFALSNNCNLACVMCSGEFSSTIRTQEGLPPLPKAYDERFFEDLRKFLPHARALTFLGGEPFVQQECFRIWDMLMDMGLSPSCNVTTNGSIHNAKVARVLQNLPVNLAISIDGVTKETIERVRVNIKYETLMANIERFTEYARGNSDRYASKRRRWLEFNYCVMRQNWHELADFFLFTEEVGARVWTVLVTSPSHCSLFYLPREELRSIVNKLEDLTPALATRLKLNKDEWLALIKELRGHAEQDASAVEAIVTSWMRTPPSAMERAWSYMAQGKEEEALQAALQTQPTDPLYYKALVLIGNIWLKRSDYGPAERAFADALALTAESPEAYLGRARLRHRQGRFADGLADLELAEEVIGKSGDVEGAISENLRHLQVALRSPLSRIPLYMAQGKEEKALEAALQIESADPLYYEALALIGMIRLKRSDYERAEQVFSEALALKAERPEAYLGRAWLRYHQGRIADGLADLKLAEEAAGQSDGVGEFIVDGVLVVGSILAYRRSDRPRALEKLERYRTLKPDKGDRQRALEQLKPYLLPKPDDVYASELLDGKTI